MIRNILIGTALATLAMNPALAQEINVKLGVLNDAVADGDVECLSRGPQASWLL